MSISYEIERLLNFALNKKLIHRDDIIVSKNALLNLLKVNEPYIFADDEKIEENLETATQILDNILDYCAKENIIADDTITYRDLMNAEIMGLLMPRASEVNSEFNRLYKKSKKSATDYFYALSQDSNYIQVDRIANNLYWTTKTDFGDLEITINLSKPEKDPKEIAAAKSLPQTNYPKCLLCKENEGFFGNINHPGRQNHRLVRVDLNDEEWLLQYSPYVYYNEHCIVLHKEHVPMKITKDTFKRLLDFVDFLPHYFVGSNSDIPIVGGSILTHDHYQGGHHVFPMETAESIASYSHKDYAGINISIIKWPLSSVRISGNEKDKLVELAMNIMNNWKKYSDKSAEILAFTDDIPHNAITPIARKNREGLFELDLVLRNNRTSQEHPFGIFHPYEQLHHIKKENIGLIEVMGLAVLPGRLSEELNEITNIISGSSQYKIDDIKDLSHVLNKHYSWILELIENYNTNNLLEDAKMIIQKEVGLIFSKVLEDAGVFKYNEAGRSQFNKFMLNCDFEVL